MPPTGNVFTCDAGTRVREALCFANIEEVFRPFDLRKLIERNQGRQHSLLSEYINPQMAGVLKTIGFDPVYVRGLGAHLWDDRGNDYLDMLAGFGVVAVGRSHPKV
jgi:4-aminobutyrate aminotransferase-like enzyme